MAHLHRLRAGAIFGMALALALSVALTVPVSAGQTLTAGQKATLQAAMQRHIDSRLVDGVYLRLNMEQGTVKRLHPVSAHPMILRMGRYFVLCSDFRDDQGRAVNVDFYLAPRGKRFVVFQSVVDNRAVLHKLMKAKKVSPAT